ncbi:MAG: hypothetical protein WCG05_00450 [Alphaproteobacteria bacterium]
MRLNFFKKHTCSHCFKVFRLWEAPLVCGSPALVCTSKTPALLSPLAFSKSLLKNHVAANCAHCCYETSQQICPHCHQPLLKDYFKAPSHLISLVAPSTEQAESYVQKLTNYIKTFGLDSWTLVQEVPEQQAFLLAQGKKCLWIRFSVHTYDAPHIDKMSYSSSVFLMLEENESAAAFNFLQGMPKKILSKPTAVLWPHLDKMMAFLPKTNVFFQKSQNDSQEIHQETSGIIGSYLGVNFLRFLKENLRSAQFFTISLGADSETGWRLEDPLLWAMTKNSVFLNLPSFLKRP